MAKEEPPLLTVGREPTNTGLLFDDILQSMGVSDLLNSDSEQENDTKGAMIIESKADKLKDFEYKNVAPVIETSSDSDAAPAAILTEVIKLSPE